MKLRISFLIFNFCYCVMADFAALPLCSGEPEPTAGSGSGGCATYPGAEKLLAATQ